MILIKDLGILCFNLLITGICASLGLAFFNLSHKELIFFCILSLGVVYLTTSGVELLCELRLRNENNKKQALERENKKFKKRIETLERKLQQSALEAKDQTCEIVELKAALSHTKEHVTEAQQSASLAQALAMREKQGKEQFQDQFLAQQKYASQLEKNMADTLRFFPPNKPFLFQKLSETCQSKLEALSFRSSVSELLDSEATENGYRQRYKHVSEKLDQVRKTVKSLKGTVASQEKTIADLKLQYEEEIEQRDQQLAIKDKVIGTKVNKITTLQKRNEAFKKKFAEYQQKYPAAAHS